ncbi:hypothetical protein NE237_015928 [Protea cynaroides]|uniref:E3 ubiquitin-protein ligase PRT1 n=1 Tax=Protea cynaroides TaxID=273540 RepID=A0A9Q0KEY0_9MAGN|nr:hypothetical protein NE237_015928 [Protea cynaroides]
MKISRKILDASGKTMTVEEILTIEIKLGWKKGTKITFREKGDEQLNVIPAGLSNKTRESIVHQLHLFPMDGMNQKVSRPTTTLLDLENLDSSDNNDEEISESFVCCVCLDLLYKPIALACGHISCFWCVHEAMNVWRESHCPICRCPYNYFPSICKMLHFLLLKMYPVAYKRREKQVLEEEKKTGFFSPQIDDHFSGSQINEELNLLSYPPHSSTRSLKNIYSGGCSVGKVNPCRVEEPLEFNMQCYESSTTTCGNSSECSEWDTKTTKKLAGGENEQNWTATGKQVSASDVQCAACKQLLFRPVVLNCGHVYCESCIAAVGVELLRCQVCQSIHPKGLPQVCLELDQFLERQFSKEYELRKQAVHSCQNRNASASATQDGKQGAKSSFLPKNLFFWWRETGSKVHVAVGCDSCGMYPIIGERYRCKDCVEKIGFDLCGECYNTCSKLPGRFNQQHTPEHKFELIQPGKMQNSMLGVLAMLFEGGPASVLSSDASPVPSPGDTLECPEYLSVPPIHSHDAPENQEDSLGPRKYSFHHLKLKEEKGLWRRVGVFKGQVAKD